MDNTPEMNTDRKHSSLDDIDVNKICLGNMEGGQHDPKKKFMSIPILYKYPFLDNEGNRVLDSDGNEQIVHRPLVIEGPRIDIPKVLPNKNTSIDEKFSIRCTLDNTNSLHEKFRNMLSNIHNIGMQHDTNQQNDDKEELSSDESKTFEYYGWDDMFS